jgi:hypothetical protein
MRVQNNLLLLVLIHLLILWYPQMIKSVHVHSNKHVSCHNDHGVSFDTPEKLCTVCDFEFISFIEATQTNLQVCLPEIKIANHPAPESAYPQLLFFFSLRAPPVS